MGLTVIRWLGDFSQVPINVEPAKNDLTDFGILKLYSLIYICNNTFVSGGMN